MGCDTIRYSGVHFGFLTDAENVIDFKGYKSKYCIGEDELEEMTDELEEKFIEFLQRKFEDSIPKGFLAMKFKMFYQELFAEYEAAPHAYPVLALGYDFHDFLKTPKSLNSIGDVNILCSFPENSHDLLSEFYAETELKLNRKKTNAKRSKKSESNESDESDDEALPEAEMEKLKKTYAKAISYGMHGYVR